MISLLHTLILSACALSAPAPPQVENQSVQHWSTLDGLPQNTITHIASGHDGAIYLTSFGGFVRFDGIAFEQFDLSTTPELGSSRASCVEVAENGDIFVSTYAGRLLRKRGADWKRINLPDIGRAPINDLSFGPNGLLWMATANGLYSLRPNATHAQRIETGAFTTVIAVEESSAFAFRHQPNEVLHIVNGVTTKTPTLPLPQQAFGLDLAVDTGGLVYLTAGKQLLCLKEEAWTQLPVELSVIQQLVADDQNGVYLLGSKRLAYWQDGQVQWNNGAEELNLPPNGGLRSLHFDADGNTWIGSNTMGLFLLTPSPLGSIRPASDRAPYISAAATDQHGNVYGLGETLWKVAGAEMEAMLDIIPRSMTPRAAGGFWLRLKDGIAPWDGELGPIEIAQTQFKVGPAVLLEDEAGLLRIAQSNQVLVWDGEQLEALPFPESFPPSSPQAFTQDSQGRFWLARKSGITIIDGSQFKHLESGQELPNGSIRELFEAPDGAMWIGTYGAGLWRIRGDQVRPLTRRNGLYENFATAISLTPDGQLIVMGNRAITAYSFVELNQAADGSLDTVYGRAFNSGHGIDIFEGNASGVHNQATDANGVIWMPAMRGLTHFDPSALPPLPSPPFCQVTAILPETASSAPEGPGYVLHSLDSAERNLVLSFGAPSFVTPRQLRYRYRLKGLEQDWNHIANNPTVAYAGLPPGDYVFEIQAAVANGGFGPLNDSTHIRVRETLIESSLLRWLAFGIGLVAIGGWIQLKSRTAATLQVQLESKVAERTGELEREIAERERVESDLRVASAELEHKVSNRTSHLAEALTSLEWDMNQREILETRLRESEKLESVGRLAGSLAHDFNNNLTAVLGEIDLASSYASPDELSKEQHIALRAHLAGARLAGLRAVQITSRLLAYGRQQASAPEVIDPLETLIDLHETFDSQVPRHVAIAITPGSKSQSILIDPARFKQALSILVLNASEAMPKGGTISLATRIISNRDRRFTCVISVSDTGPGLSLQERKRIFEPFYTTKDKSSGLGLATVQSIIFQSGGNIHVESEAGAGCTFHIALPVTDKALAPRTQAPQEHDLTGVTILLVDDDVNVLRVTESMLSKSGAKVFATDVPSQAIELAARHGDTIQALITDVFMPELSGEELLMAVRRHCPKIKSLFISGYSLDLLQDRGLLSEETNLLIKPFNTVGLLARVSKLILT